jgi:hypothetical protein
MDAMKITPFRQLPENQPWLILASMICMPVAAYRSHVFASFELIVLHSTPAAKIKDKREPIMRR